MIAVTADRKLVRENRRPDRVTIHPEMFKTGYNSDRFLHSNAPVASVKPNTSVKCYINQDRQMIAVTAGRKLVRENRRPDRVTIQL